MEYLAHGKWKIYRWMHTNDIIAFGVKASVELNMDLNIRKRIVPKSIFI